MNPFLRDLRPHDPVLTSQFEHAYQHFIEQLPSDPVEYMRVLGHLGSLARVLSRFDEAIIYLEQALQLARNLQRPEAEVVYLIRLGTAFHHSEQWEKAEAYFQEALPLTQQPTTHPWQDFVYQHLGKLRVEQGRYPEARRCIQIALQLRQIKGEPDLLASTLAVVTALAEIENQENI